MQSSITTRVLGLLAVLLASFAIACGAFASDKVHLKDGTVVEGKIDQELDGNVWIITKIGSIENRRFLRATDVERIERDTSTPDAAAQARPTRAVPTDARARAVERAKRATVITLGEGGGKDMVGMYMTAESLRRIIPLLEEENIGIVVFRIKSGGGYLFEIEHLSNVIHNEYKPKFRTVAWIDSAISAAAMTAHCIEDIYFMPQGNYGACTGWFGALTAVKDRELEDVLYLMERISARGGYDPQIMRSMQIMEPLSCSIDSNGDVKWFNSLDGEYVVNPENRILTFNAVDAERFKFSKGTAANLNELAKAMGLTEVEWVGETRRGIMWPVSKAEQAMMKFRDTTYTDEVNTNQYFDTYQNAINAARAEQDRQRRGAMVGRARNALRQIVRMVNNNPNFAMTIIGVMPDKFQEWVSDQESMLRDLMR